MLLFDDGKRLEKAFTKEQFDALAAVLERRDNTLATSRELADVKAELKADVAALREEIHRVRYEMPKWQLGIAAALALIMAKGFGWLGF